MNNLQPKKGPMTSVVVGSGAFGLSTALELSKNNDNNRVIVIEQYGLLDDRISSNDINRIVRSDYIGDMIYTNLAKYAIQKYKEWNYNIYPQKMYYQDKQLVIESKKFEENSYANLSMKSIQKDDPNTRKMSYKEIMNRIPAWKTGLFSVDYWLEIIWICLCRYYTEMG